MSLFGGKGGKAGKPLCEQDGTDKKWAKAKGKKASKIISRKQGVEAVGMGSPRMRTNTSQVPHCQNKNIYFGQTSL